MFKNLSTEEKEDIIRLSSGLKREWILEWIWLQIIDFLCGFGERILIVVRTFILSFLGFSMFYFLLMFQCIQTSLTCLHDAFYISFSALSNLGYNPQDLQFQLPLWAKWFVQLEAFWGEYS